MSSPAAPLVSAPCNLCGGDDPEERVRVDGFSYVRCRRCGLVYVNPRLADLRGWHVDRYRGGRDGRGAGADIARQYEPARMARLEREVRRYAGARRLNRLLDVGCSAGAFLSAARRQGWEACGVEVAEECAREGRDREGLDIRCGTLGEAAFPDGRFDLVRMHNVLEHLPDPLGELREAARVLREGGVLAVATVNGRSLSAIASGPAWRYYEPHCHVTVFTRATLRRMLRRAGFGGVRISTHGFRWGTTPRGAAARRLERLCAAAARAAGLGHRLRAVAAKG